MGRMEISSRELRDMEIKAAVRGYDRDDVNDILERAADTIDAANERVQQMTERLATAQTEAGRTRETEDVLHRTLLLAQRAADEAVAEATAKARQMLDDADLQARRLVADSEAEARRKGESERRRLEEEIIELASRRDALLADVEALTRFEAEYRERMVRALEADLFALRSRPTTAPGARPETAEVEVPIASETRDEDLDATMPPQSAPPFGRSPTPPPAPAPPPAPVADAPEEVDVRTLFEKPAEPASASNTGAPPASGAPTPPPQPINLLANDGVDADVLDDDAFFATLRDAVHDEAPLGPRDDDDVTGENSFFDQDAGGGFRDVFRRRR
jgi:cell division septum initiation protein DivIVA